MTEYLLDKLQEYGRSGVYPLHMPGHKRNLAFFENPYAIDITEIDGFDNLSHAEGVLLEAQRRAAQLYGAEESFYLVNGSTGGILAAVSACVRRGGRILMARNCHKAVYHAALLNGLSVTYLYPETDLRLGMNGAVLPETVRRALRESGDPDTAHSSGRFPAVVITSPTYDGVVSDIRAIAHEVHQAGAILIVDEAHGAHFDMHPYFPESALACGADLVINSLHKTMPSLTQTALLHVQGPRVDRDRLRRYLGIYQSSSPSYVLMAGMDACVRLMQEQGKNLFDLFTARLEKLRQELGGLRHLYLVTGREPGLHAFDFDRSRILISTVRCVSAESVPGTHGDRTGSVPGGYHGLSDAASGTNCGPGSFASGTNCGLTGSALGKLLRTRYRLEPEMEAENYVTAILTAADTGEGLKRLRDALYEIDRMLVSGSEASGNPAGVSPSVLPHPEAVLRMDEAENAPSRAVPLPESGGLISAEFACLYPPGIPLIVPGERIPDGLPGLLLQYQAEGLHLQGLRDPAGRTIQILP